MTIKLCKDCKYCSKDWFSAESAKCMHHRAQYTEDTFSNVTGKETHRIVHIYCSARRSYRCGEEAKYFVPKLKFSWHEFLVGYR